MKGLVLQDVRQQLQKEGKEWVVNLETSTSILLFVLMLQKGEQKMPAGQSRRQVSLHNYAV